MTAKEKLEALKEMSELLTRYIKEVGNKVNNDQLGIVEEITLDFLYTQLNPALEIN